MKLIRYIFVLAVLFALFYCGVYLIFYAMSVEDLVMLLMGVCFLGLCYFWNVMMQPAKDEYMIKLISLLKKLSED